METKKPDFLADKRLEKTRMLKRIAFFCERQRFQDVDLKGVPPSALDDLGTEIANLFLERMRQLQEKTPQQ